MSNEVAYPQSEPSDAERESYLPPDLYNKLMTHLLTESGRDGLFLADEIRNATGASKLRRPAQTEPTDAEREALPVASRDVWGWDTCVVCGSKEVSDRGMVIMGASNGTPYVARIAWCDQSQECREDLRQTSFLLTEPDVKVIDMDSHPKAIEHEWKVME